MNNLQVLDTKKAEIKALFAPTLTELEFDYFLGLAKSLNANPFKREIYAIKYSNQLSIFCGRDLYRRVAQEQPDYLVHTVSAVYEKDVFEINNGQVTHKISGLNRGNIVGAYCSLFKKNCNIPFTKFVLYSEYVKQTSIWKTMPATMIEKVAESQTFRMAYQGIFAGTFDESEKWEVPQSPAPVIQTPKVLTELQDDKVGVIINSLREFQSILELAETTKEELDNAKIEVVKICNRLKKNHTLKSESLQQISNEIHFEDIKEDLINHYEKAS